MFKQWRINRAKIKLAGKRAELSSLRSNNTYEWPTYEADLACDIAMLEELIAQLESSNG